MFFADKNKVNSISLSCIKYSIFNKVLKII
jgi:hypothetical protein